MLLNKLTITKIMVATLTLCLSSPGVLANDASAEAMTGGTPVDASATEATTEANPDQTAAQTSTMTLRDRIIDLNRELFILEEALLTPADTQVNIFITSELDQHSLDQIELEINGKRVTTHLYTDRENKALGRGATQRLYHGNLDVGAHEIEARTRGLTHDGNPVTHRTRFTIDKLEQTKYIQLNLVDDETAKGLVVSLDQWDG